MQENLQRRIKELQEQIIDFPDGHLCFGRNGKHTKWFLNNGDKNTYLSKKQREKAEIMALKRYYQEQLDHVQQEEKLLEKMMKRWPEKPKTEETLKKYPDYRKLLEASLHKSLSYAEDWEKEDYDKNPNYPKKLIYRTVTGEYVRSKSEMIIADLLFLNKIAYRYECLLEEMKDQKHPFYPDFTILHPITKQIIYWEHFGMMDDHSYQSKTYNKLRIMGKYNIIPTINLITTYETSEHPINSAEIQQIIQKYFF